MMSDSPIDFRPDGSLTFTIDDDQIVWRPPKVKHFRTAANAYYSLVEYSNNQLGELREKAAAVAEQQITDDADRIDLSPVGDELEALNDEVHAKVVQWVRDRHADLNLPASASMPDDEDEWPMWLARIKFATAVMEHWRSNPFG